MSAIFDFSSLITIFLLFICTCTFIRTYRDTIFDPRTPSPSLETEQPPGTTMTPGKRISHDGILGFCWKMSRIGERKSEYVGACCIIMAIHVLFFK